VSDLDDLVRQKRYEDIHQARRQVRDDNRSIAEAVEIGQISREQGNRLLKQSVDSYLRELQTLLNPPQDDEGKGDGGGEGGDEDDDTNKYWHEKRIGTIDLPNGKRAVVDGLSAFLKMDNPIEVTVQSVDSDHYYEMGSVHEKQVAVHVPRSLSLSAYDLANEALAELGLELNISDEARTEIDDDLMEEIEQWRQANL